MAGCAARVPPGSEARLSLATFLLGASVLALPLLTRAGLQSRTGLALYVAGLNALLLLLYRPPRYQVRAGCGGTAAGDGADRVDRLTRTPDPDQGLETGGAVDRVTWTPDPDLGRDRAGRTTWTGKLGPHTRDGAGRRGESGPADPDQGPGTGGPLDPDPSPRSGTEWDGLGGPADMDQGWMGGPGQGGQRLGEPSRGLGRTELAVTRQGRPGALELETGKMSPTRSGTKQARTGQG